MHQTLYDPIRKKEVADTPEERIRQATIRFLLDVVKVPEHMMSVEFPLATIDPSTDERADIVVHNFREGATIDKPWLMVECKAPDEYTWPELQVQLNRYLKVLTPNYIMLALGDTTRYFILDPKNKTFSRVDSLPEYSAQNL